MPGALALLTRMMRAGDRHPLQVMAILHSQQAYVRMMRLERDAVHYREQSGLDPQPESGSAARKVLDRSRKLGGTNIIQAIQLLAQADLDLRGVRDLPDDAVMEILVARLCRLAPRR